MSVSVFTAALIAIVASVVVAFIAWTAAIAYRTKSYESKIGSAEEKSREIIDEALKTADKEARSSP